MSNFKVNYGKTEAIGIEVKLEELEQIKTNFDFRWTDSHINYLGTKITGCLNRLFELNYVPLARRTKTDLDKWDKGTFTWFGRTNILKMNVLPKMLYIIQALPIKIPQSYLKELRSRFLKFMWAGKPARISRTILSLPKGKGGIGFPDLIKYQEAAHLAKVVDWCGQKEKPWIKMEQATVEVPLEGLAWTPDREITSEVKKHPTIGATIRIIKKIFVKTKLSEDPSPLAPILGTNAFRMGLTDPKFKALQQRGIYRVMHFSKDNRLMTRGEMEREGMQELDFLRLMQLDAFLRTKIGVYNIIRNPSKFEQTCLEGKSIRHSLSHFYVMLTNLDTPQEFKFIQEWERDLKLTFTQEQKDKILRFTHKASVASKYEEGSYKILTRWYRTPAVLHRIYPETSEVCWRCLEAEGTLVHIWWECRKIQEFWQMTLKTIEKITGFNLADKPSAVLLLDIPMTMEKYQNSLLRHLIIAARACIPVLWKQEIPPSRAQWLAKVAEIQQMESLTMTLKDQDERYQSIWAPYERYREGMARGSGE